jgi:hypothetical protein
MEALKKLVSERLEKKQFCTVFEQDLDRVWPPASESEKQRKEIIAFAKANGWSVKFSDPGLRAVFRKPDATGY